MIKEPYLVCSISIAVVLTDSVNGTRYDGVREDPSNITFYIVGTYNSLPVYADSNISFFDSRLYLVTLSGRKQVSYGERSEYHERLGINK